MIREESSSFLAELARVSIAFEVSRVLDVTPRAGADGGFDVRERPVRPTYRKDYDAISGNHPTDWARDFDTANWGFFSARAAGQAVGGCVIAVRTPGLDMLEGRCDLAVVWDIRVAPEARGAGVGSALLAAAERRASDRGCTELKVETQDTNVPACRFYERHGFALRMARHGVYPELPDEVQLLWYRPV